MPPLLQKVDELTFGDGIWKFDNNQGLLVGFSSIHTWNLNISNPELLSANNRIQWF